MNVIKNKWADIEKNYFKSKYKLLINGRERVGTKNSRNPKSLRDYSQTIDDVHEHLEGYNPAQKRRVLIMFDDMIADMESNKKIILIVTKLFLRGRNPAESNTLFYHRNSYQKRTSTNSIKSFVWHCF